MLETAINAVEKCGFEGFWAIFDCFFVCSCFIFLVFVVFCVFFPCFPVGFLLVRLRNLEESGPELHVCD